MVNLSKIRIKHKCQPEQQHSSPHRFIPVKYFSSVQVPEGNQVEQPQPDVDRKPVANMLPRRE